MSTKNKTDEISNAIAEVAKIHAEQSVTIDKIIESLRAAQPHMVAMGDALNRYVPPATPEDQAKASRFAHMNKLVAIADFIGTASLLDCKMIINELIDRVSTLTGSASELEDAGCALTKEIELEKKHEKTP